MLKVLTCTVQISLFNLLLSLSIYAETLSVRANKHDFPATYLRDTQWQGMDIELIKTVLQRAKLDYQIIESPFKRSLAELKSGDISLMPNLVKNAERSVYLDWLGPIRITCIGLVVIEKDKNLPIGTVEELINIAQQNKMKIAYPSGASYSPFFDAKLKNDLSLGEILYFVNDDALKHQMLKKRRIMGYFADAFEIQQRLLDPQFIDEYKGLTLHSYRIEESCTGAFVGVSKKLSKPLNQKIMAAFQSMKTDGTFNQIHLDWVGSQPKF